MANFSRDEAYNLLTSSDHRNYYDSWAKTYEQDFAYETSYIYPEQIAGLMKNWIGSEHINLADIGCGTGLIGDQLRETGWVIDGFDISEGMLAEAKKKKVYQELICLDLKNKNDYPKKKYSALVSSGSFTLGHLGPDALKKTLGLCTTGSRCLVGVNLEHFEDMGFQTLFTNLQDEHVIENFEIISVPIYKKSNILNDKKSFANVCKFEFLGHDNNFREL
jgi:SAM-dependent methyltransferase